MDHEGRPYISSTTGIKCRGDPRGRPASLLLLAKIVRTPLSTLEPGYPAPGPTWLSLHLSRPSMPRRSPMLSRSGSGRGPDRQCASADHPCRVHRRVGDREDRGSRGLCRVPTLDQALYTLGETVSSPLLPLASC